MLTFICRLFFVFFCIGELLYNVDVYELSPIFSLMHMLNSRSDIFFPAEIVLIRPVFQVNDYKHRYKLSTCNLQVKNLEGPQVMNNLLMQKY